MKEKKTSCEQNYKSILITPLKRPGLLMIVRYLKLSSPAFLLGLLLYPFSSFVHAEGSCLDFKQTLEWITTDSSSIKIAELEVEAVQAAEHQACLWHNPVISLEYETGDAGYCGWDGAEFTLGITQEFELGGKCKAERQIAKVETLEAMWDYESRKLDLALELTEAFIEASLWQEKIRIAEKQLQLAQNKQSCVHEKAQEGKASLLKVNKAAIECTQKQFNLKKVKNQSELVKKKLSLLCENFSAQNFESVAFPFFNILPVPPLSALECDLQNSPEWEKTELSLVAAYSVTQFEKKLRYPDLEVTAGISSGEKFRENGFFIELAIPFPLFDRNQGNIDRAYLKENQAYFIKESRQFELKNILASSYSEWKNAFENAKDLQTLAKSSTETLNGYEQGFNEGKFEKTEWLEEQLASLELQDQFLEALAEYHHKKAETLRLIGQWERCENES